MQLFVSSNSKPKQALLTIFRQLGSDSILGLALLSACIGTRCVGAHQCIWGSGPPPPLSVGGVSTLSTPHATFTAGLPGMSWLWPGIHCNSGGGAGSKPVSQTPHPPYWALGAGPTKVIPHAHSKHHKCTAPPGKCCTYRFKPPTLWLGEGATPFRCPTSTVVSKVSQWL